MITVRPYKASDKTCLQNICIATCNDKTFKEKDLPLLYNDYYTENEPENCFVLDDDGKPVGYVICSTDSKSFYAKMPYYVKQASYLRGVAFNHELKLQRRYEKLGYKAHLHIDILPDYVHKGYGTKLMNTLLQSLESNGVEKIFLCCARSNENALAFYRKCGFEIIGKIPFCYLMGKSLNSCC